LPRAPRTCPGESFFGIAWKAADEVLQEGVTEVTLRIGPEPERANEKAVSIETALLLDGRGERI